MGAAACMRGASFLVQAQSLCLLQRDGPRCPAVCLRVTRMVSFEWFSRGATKFQENWLGKVVV